FMLSVSYEDRFGKLGKIAVITGQRGHGRLHVDTWVLSYRAFARRIEYQCLNALFKRYGAPEMTLAYEKTSRNGPIGRFFKDLLGTKPEGTVTLDRTAFLEACPKLFHRVSETGQTWRTLQPT